MKSILDTIYVSVGFLLGLLMLTIPIFIFGFVLEVAHHFTKLLLN